MIRLTFLLILLYFNPSVAQENLFSKKINPELADLLKSHPGSDTIIDILVSGNTSLVKSFVEINNGHYKYSVGRISSIDISLDKIPALCSLTDVDRVRYNDLSKVFLCNDTARMKNNVDLVQAGHYPLTQSYTGKNVIIGLVETIDRHHPDFLDSLGHTRVLYYWAYRDSSGNSPANYTYGTEYNSSDIDNGLADVTLSTNEHGSACAGVACGNARANGLSLGVAPDADIIIAPFGADGIKYIFDKAASLGRPCVISISTGGYYTGLSLVNNDLMLELWDSLLTSQNGRAISVSSGNAGNLKWHYTYNGTADTMMAFSQVIPIVSGDTNSLKNIRFSLSAYKDSILNPYPAFSTPFLSYDSFYTQHVYKLCGPVSGPPSNWSYWLTIDKWNSENIAVIRIFTDGLYYNHAKPNCDSLGNYYWKLTMTGVGDADLTNFLSFDAIPSPQLHPEFQHYMFSDNLCNLNAYCVSDKVIAVGYAQSRSSHIDYNGNLSIDTNAFPDHLLGSSSHGPTLRGLIKPDIVGTANYVMTALPLSRQADMIANGADRIDQGGFHVREGGTSMAAPLVAGGIALYFEKYPNASWLDVKNAIINCPKLDSYTGTSLPDNFWGYGKFDAFGLLTNCAPIYIEEGELNRPSVSPNPFVGSTKITWRATNKKIDLKIISFEGKIIKSCKLSSLTSELIIHDLPAGVYIYNLEAEDFIYCGKLISLN